MANCMEIAPCGSLKSVQSWFPYQMPCMNNKFKYLQRFGTLAFYYFD